MRYLASDLKKMFRSKSICTVFILLAVIMVADPILSRISADRNDNWGACINPYLFSITMNPYGAGSDLYNRAFWLLPALLSNLLLYTEQITSMEKLLIARGSRFSYYFSKMAAVFLFSFCYILSLLLLNLGIVCAAFPGREVNPSLVFAPIPGTFSYSAFQISPIFASLVYGILNALAIALLALFCTALSLCIKFPNPYVAAIVPPVAYFLILLVIDSSGARLHYSMRIVVQPMAAAVLATPITLRQMICSFLIWVFLDLALVGIGMLRRRDLL